MGRRCTDLIGWLGSVLVAGLLIGVAEWPYQWLSEAGFRLQALWPLGGGAPRSPLLAALPLVGTALFMALAWGPLAAGRGGGITGILALQDNQEQPLQERALASLSLQRQLVRLPLLALTHLAGLSVGTESPSAALGASLLLALRGRLAPLRTLPPALLAAIGGGAGLGAAFRSPLLGAAYALEELSAQKGLALVTPTLALAGIGTLLHSGVGRRRACPEASPPPWSRPCCPWRREWWWWPLWWGCCWRGGCRPWLAGWVVCCGGDRSWPGRA